MEIRFPINQQVVEPSFPIPLKAGLNKITVTMDPGNKTAESNENNNSFSVFFNVIDPDAPPVKHPPIKTQKKLDLTTTGQIFLLNDQKSHKAMDPQKDFIMKDGASVKLETAKAGSCGTYDGVTTCVFWVGFTGLKNLRPDLRAQTEYTMYDNGKKRYGLGMDFVPGVTKIDSVFKLVLTLGDHDIEIKMDPSDGIKEENENNNSLKFHALVTKY
jgi:subtilase family serine protease